MGEETGCSSGCLRPDNSSRDTPNAKAIREIVSKVGLGVWPLNTLVIVGRGMFDKVAISKLVNGKQASEISTILAGNTCGPRPTSCADQLSIALQKAISNE